MKDTGNSPLWLAALLPLLISLPAAAVPIDALKCEYRLNPLGIDALNPRLSWLIDSAARGQRQTGYQILVASSAANLNHDVADLWDSGNVAGDASIQIEYAGKPLLAHEECFWKARIWDSDGVVGNWSQPSIWTMGPLGESDWHAAWIDAPNVKTQPIFRRIVHVEKPIARALIDICGLGQFELRVNGRQASDDVLQPGWTDYRKTCLYVTYDVTNLLNQPDNSIAVLLGNGMFNIPNQPGRYTKFKGSFGPLKVIAQLHIAYVDGSTETIGTDHSWKATGSPITFSSIYGGEDYDARLESRTLDESNWTAAEETTGPGGKLIGSSGSALPITIAHLYEPIKLTEPLPEVYVYDFGQNCALIPRLTVRGPAGATVRMMPGEILGHDGRVSQHGSGGPAYFDYTLKGDSNESWSPRFCYYGSRYIQVTGAVPAGLDNPSNLPVVLNIVGQFVTSSSPAAGEFECSNDLFNRTANLIRWAMRSNMQSILTDCPHREKLGWLEQDHLVGPSLMYSFDLAALMGKASADMRDAQLENGLVPDIAPEYVKFPDGFRDSPEWGSACVLVPWQVYQWYGDVEILRRGYNTMKWYVEYLGTTAKDHIVSHGLGDWYDLGPKHPGPSQLTPTALTATAFYYRDISVLSQVAAILGNKSDADHYASLASDVRLAFNKSLYNPHTHNYATASQCANSIPLVFHLAPEADRDAIVANVVADVRKHSNGLTAGDVGYRYLLRALAEAGRSDVIYDMNCRSDHPGYGYILAHGATSLTEGWDGSASQDHFMLGHIMEWFCADLAGIQCDPNSVAFKKIVIHPTPVGDVTWAKAGYQSPYGKIVSSWRRTDGNFTLDVTIPPNTTATIYLPSAKGDTVESDGATLVQTAENSTVFATPSGSYHFICTHPNH